MARARTAILEHGAKGPVGKFSGKAADVDARGHFLRRGTKARFASFRSYIYIARPIKHAPFTKHDAGSGPTSPAFVSAAARIPPGTTEY